MEALQEEGHLVHRLLRGLSDLPGPASLRLAKFRVQPIQMVSGVGTVRLQTFQPCQLIRHPLQCRREWIRSGAIGTEREGTVSSASSASFLHPAIWLSRAEILVGGSALLARGRLQIRLRPGSCVPRHGRASPIAVFSSFSTRVTTVR